MPHVRMKIDVVGLRDGQPWPRRDELLECSEREAAHLIHAGYAEPADIASDVDEATNEGEASETPLADPGPTPDDVPDAKVSDVMAWVDSDPARARAALEAEQTRGDKPRTTLVDQLNEIIEEANDAANTADPGEGPDAHTSESDAAPTDPAASTSGDQGGALGTPGTLS